MKRLSPKQHAMLIAIDRANRLNTAITFSAAENRTTLASLNRRGLVSLDGRYPVITNAGRRELKAGR